MVSFYFGQKIGDKREEFQRINSENVGELKAENVGELKAEETPENPSDELLSNIPH
ncbi:MAG: hypothetical protein LBG59_08065 [Candidatus Peribacteria bacterium]|nr:hypothetical protein [Candidatus Peribacteria bacterium]